jgi:hypothetical protein
MESALVRKDAVMLHEPMRRHLRATAVGVVLGMFGLVAFFIVGKFRPVSELSVNEIIIGRPSRRYMWCRTTRGGSSRCGT